MSLRPFATSKSLVLKAIANPRPLYIAARTLATAARPSEHLHTHVNVTRGHIPGKTMLSDLIRITRGKEVLLVGLPCAFPKRTWPVKEVHTFQENESAYFRGPEGGIHDQEIFVFGVQDVDTLKMWDHDHSKMLELVEYVCAPARELTNVLEMSQEHALYLHGGQVKSVNIAHLPGIGHALKDAMEGATESTPPDSGLQAA